MMRTILITCFLAVAVSAGAIRTVVLDVQKMTCALCAITVQKALQKVPGVAEVRIDYDRKTATVKYDGQWVNTAELLKATSDAGFPAAFHVVKP